MSKNVVVFGGAGFLGSHVADALTDRGFPVTIFDRRESAYRQPGQEMIVGDILDEAAVREAVRDAQIVYNFAGIAGIDETAQRPLDSVKVNVLGTGIILEACRQAKVERLIFASSLYVYGKSGSFYRSTKQACELLIENYQEVFGLDYTILRYGSLYGPRADRNNAIDRFIRQAVTEKKITRHGDGNELREYIHVLDAARGSVDILDEEFRNQNIILTGQQQTPIRELLEMIREMFNGEIDIEYVTAKPSHHYEITPYAFAPRLGKRLVRRSYLDMGQGILDYIYRVAEEVRRPQESQEPALQEKGR